MLSVRGSGTRLLRSAAVLVLSLCAVRPVLFEGPTRALLAEEYDVIVVGGASSRGPRPCARAC